MAIFYLLPPRECLEQASREFLERYLPGIELPELWAELVAVVERQRPETYLIHREDLPDSDSDQELQAIFGVEPGDTVVEVSLPKGGHSAETRLRFVSSSICESSENV